MSNPRFTRVEFFNFKTFRRFTVSLDHINVLVGPNNSGKSTIIAAFRALEAALRRARSRKPDRLLEVDGQPLGYPLSPALFPISTENVATDYDEVEARIVFRMSQDRSLTLHFPPNRQFYMLAEGPKGVPKSVADFKNAFPISVVPVPQLGPLEHDEPVVEEQTVSNSLATHRASRHFRNYWRYFPDNFEKFAELIQRTWPGMEVEPPELVLGQHSTVSMCCQEHRRTRELFWAGVGFQIWCQLLTHIIRAEGATILLIDEPEIYLHPDVQRQLLGLLRSRNVDVLLATHSTEIVGEADPEEVLLVEKTRTSARRVRDVEGVQNALDAIGSIHNITLAQLARTRRLLFTEGTYDYKVIRRFAAIFGHEELAAGAGATHVESDGFTGWERIRDFAWGLQKTVGAALRIAAVFDRDYFPVEQVDVLLESLRAHIAFAAVLHRKEIENYFLVPSALQRAMDRALAESERRGRTEVTTFDIRGALIEIMEPLRKASLGHYQEKRMDWLRSSRKSTSAVYSETIDWFEDRWKTLETRVEIVPGKIVLGALRERVKTETGVTLTDNRILTAFKQDEVPGDMALLVKDLERFRTTLVPEAAG